VIDRHRRHRPQTRMDPGFSGIDARAPWARAAFASARLL